MSSRSNFDPEVPEPSRHTRPLPRISNYGSDDAIIERNTAAMTPYMVSNDHSWAHQESLGHGAGASSSIPLSSSRVMPTSMSNMSNMSVEARRQNIMAMDRKRRLTGSNHDNGIRRRNTSGGFGEREDPIFTRTPEGLPSSSRPPGRYQRRRSSPRSSADVIDLTNSPPQLTHRSHPGPGPSPRSSSSTSAIYVVPHWQPDSEVSECPICRRPFTFLFRRHHCRKCGRVVCNDCSPHRITIPRQFIVNPPGPTIYPVAGGRDTVDLTGDDDDNDEDGESTFNTARLDAHRQPHYMQNIGIGGGEKVRLCNPCVPDPQPEPQPNFTPNLPLTAPISGRRDDLLTLSDALRGSRREFLSNNRIEPFPGFGPQHSLPYASHPARIRPSSLITHPGGENVPDHSQISSYPYYNDNLAQRYRQRGNMSFDGQATMHHHHHHHRHHLSDIPRTLPQPPPNRPRVRSMLEESYLPRMFSGHVPPSSRPRLSEEDICPVCRRALPPKGADGDETAREAHIVDCINARDPSSSSQIATTTTAGETPSGSGLTAAVRGPMHMLSFIATEKDCVIADGENGTPPECSICMVEYDVGDELARLECLCKFHRECIGAWFMRKQECPVHKIS